MILAMLAENIHRHNAVGLHDDVPPYNTLFNGLYLTEVGPRGLDRIEKFKIKSYNYDVLYHALTSFVILFGL